MTANREFNDIARAWLDLMPSEAPDRVVDTVLQAVEATPQVRPSYSTSRRFTTMTRFALAAAAAAAIAIGALIVYTRPSSNVGPPSGPSPSPSSAVPSALDDALRATWLAIATPNETLGNGGGPVSLEFSPAGNGVSATNFGPGNGFASSATPVGPDQIELVLESESGICQAGARGTYRWQLSADRSELTLSGVAEDCTKRGIVLQRRWARSLLGATTVGAGVVDSMDPTFAVTLPDYDYETRTLEDFAEIATPQGDGFSLMVFKNPQPFVDPCSRDEERVPYAPGADAFIEHFQTTDAFEVGEVTELEIDGHRALHADVSGRENYERCPGPDQELYQYTPQACQCHFVVGPGYTDSMYLVEVGADTFLFIVSPFESASEQSVIDSIRLPFELPAY